MTTFTGDFTNVPWEEPTEVKGELNVKNMAIRLRLKLEPNR